jgi:hypothetical protein
MQPRTRPVLDPYSTRTRPVLDPYSTRTRQPKRTKSAAMWISPAGFLSSLSLKYCVRILIRCFVCVYVLELVSGA